MPRSWTSWQPLEMTLRQPPNACCERTRIWRTLNGSEIDAPVDDQERPFLLGNLLLRLVLPLAIQSWSLASLQQRLFKTGGRIRHARYFVLQLAESRLTKTLFGQILGRIERLAWHPTCSRAAHTERGR